MRVLIVGTGYVGLVTGVCIASQGHDVLCVDADPVRVAALRRGHCPIHEDGLEELLQEQLSVGSLEFAYEVPAVADYDVAFIAVGTPSKLDGAADLSSVFTVVEELAQKLTSESIIVTKSTVPVGTAAKIDALLHARGRTDLRVASVPEFLREGTAIQDTLQPSRLIFGVADSNTAETLQELHAKVKAPVLVCSWTTAEMIKYASNAFLATKISFINEIANICSRVDADVSQVALGMGMDPRIGRSYLRAGLGYGGSCFPKDTRALVNIAGNVDYDFKLLKAVVEVNQMQRMAPLSQLQEWLGELSGKRIAILGVAFKPGTDDVRESPAFELSDALSEKGADVVFYDPVVTQFRNKHHRVCQVMRDPYLALKDADAAILVTEWVDIVHLDWKRVAQLMRQPHIFDGRNVLDPGMMRTWRFIFASVGSQSTSIALPV